MTSRALESVLLAAWILVGGAGAWRRRPVTPRGVGPSPGGTVQEPASWLAVLDRFGIFLCARLPLLEPIPPRRVALVVVSGGAITPFVGAWSVVVVVIVIVLARAAALGAASRRLDRALSDVASIADLLGVAVASGLDIGGALIAVGARLRCGRDAGMAALVVDLERGRAVSEALDAWAGRGGPIDELVALLRGSRHNGAAIVDALGRLAADLRRRSRRSAEERARRLPVLMLLPLVSCVLPAFGLLTVVPMVAVGLGRLGRVT